MYTRRIVKRILAVSLMCALGCESVCYGSDCIELYAEDNQIVDVDIVEDNAEDTVSDIEIVEEESDSALIVEEETECFDNICDLDETLELDGTVDALNAVDKYIDGSVEDADEVAGEKLTGSTTEAFGEQFSDDMFAIGRESSKKLPAKLDNRKYATRLKKQGGHKYCWAFSCNALAEINMKKKGLASNPDYSETHLGYFMYDTVTDPLGGLEGDYTEIGYREPGGNEWDTGGLNYAAAMNLLTWKGLATESLVPYEDVDIELDDAYAYQSAAHVQGAYIGNIRNDRDTVKQLISEYGAVAVTYRSVQNFYSAKYNSFYNPIGKPGSHKVVILGWDDNFPATKFKKRPAGNGAWLVRNSATTAKKSASEYESYKGYFWMSYYDKSLDEEAIALDVQKANNYDNNYQYDGAVYTEAFSTGSRELAVANVFEAKACSSGEKLKAVSFYSPDANIDYTIDIYVNPDGNNPESGQLIEEATTKGHVSYEGYYTVPLVKPVKLKKEDTFAVVVKVLSPDGYASIGVEANYDCTRFNTVASKEEMQSFYKLDDTWEDLAHGGQAHQGNFRIKAFTTNNTCTYTIKYVLAGGYNNVANPKEYDKGDSFELRDPVRRGYDFVGWYQDKKCTEEIYNIYSDNTGNLVLYAKWSPNDYTVEFDGNGAKSGKLNALKCKYDKKYKLPSNTYSRPGYKFVGWTVRKDGLGKTYKNRSQIINLTSEYDGKVVLYAKWKKIKKK